MIGQVIRRAEVWWVRFDPSIGEEIAKTRPAVVVSNDRANANLNRFQVIPLTRTTKRIYPSEALIRVGGRNSKAAADQIMTAARERFGARIGRISPEDMEAIERAIRIQLAL